MFVFDHLVENLDHIKTAPCTFLDVVGARQENIAVLLLYCGMMI
jgi:hypothetical protein